MHLSSLNASSNPKGEHGPPEAALKWVKFNSVDALEVEVDQNERVEDVEQGQEALEEVNGLENHNVDFNEFGEDIWKANSRFSNEFRLKNEWKIIFVCF